MISQIFRPDLVPLRLNPEMKRRAFFNSGSRNNLVFCAILLFLAAIPASQVFGQNIRIYSISPAQVQVGSNAFPIVINGSHFPKDPVVRLGGVVLEVDRASWNRIRAFVPASITGNAGEYSLRVEKRGRSSNVVPLTVSSSPSGNYDWSALTVKLQSFVSNEVPLPPNTVRGLTFLLAKNGRVIYSNAFGNQTVDSVLPIASSTKFPSMLAIFTLIDDGILHLDTPISGYLNGYASVPADKAGITLRMLMNHTSGLPQPACLNDDTLTLQQCVQQILNASLLFPPGTQFSYGGGSMHVAGGIAEAVTGQTWQQIFQARVAGPLSLSRYTYGNTPNPRIAGGASSDAGDYIRMMQAYLAGGSYGYSRILSIGSYREMKVDQKRDLPVASSPGGSSLTGYSYGWWHTSSQFLQSQPTPITPGPELSDQGAFGCTPWIDLEHNFAAIILIQRSTATGTQIWNEIRPLIIQQMMN